MSRPLRRAAVLAPLAALAALAASAPAPCLADVPPESPPRWTLQIDPLTTALGFIHLQVERALGDNASLYAGPSIRLFDPLNKEPGTYRGLGGELGLRVFPWGIAPAGAWGEVRGVLASLHTDEAGGASALGGYASVLGGYTWILGGRWVLAAGLGVQYIHYQVAGLGSVGVLPAAHTALGVAF
jgi:hypothetical protein